MTHIPVAGPWISELEIEYVRRAAVGAWYEKANHYPKAFETAFAAYVDRLNAISLPSCTSGIHLSLAALGIGPGDEVIVPDATWIASSAPISYVGATPVFADIDPNTWCLAPNSVRSNITPATKAVITVDLYGCMPDMDRLEEICSDAEIALIEDAAEAVGSQYKARNAGGFGLISVFSFHGSKTLTTGEGGMVLTDDVDLHDRMMFLRDHGRRPGDASFFNTEVAFKYKMSALQAALGLAQLERVDDLVEKKREIFSWYEDRLLEDRRFSLNPEPSGTFNSYWMTTVLIEGLSAKRAELIEKLRADNIDTRPFFHPLSSIPAYSETRQGREARARNRASYEISENGLNLPSPLNLTEGQADLVASTLLRSTNELLGRQ